MTDTFENDSKAFSDFLAGDLKYEISPKIAIHDYRSDHQGRGVIASEDIEEDEVLFKIPEARFCRLRMTPISSNRSPRPRNSTRGCN